MKLRLKDIYRNFDLYCLDGFEPAPKYLLLRAVGQDKFNDAASAPKSQIIMADSTPARTREYTLMFKVICVGEDTRSKVGDYVLAVPSTQDWLDKDICLVHQDDITGTWGVGIWEEVDDTLPEGVQVSSKLTDLLSRPAG